MLSLTGCNPKLWLIFKIGFSKFISFYTFLKVGKRTFHNLFTQSALRVPGFSQFSLWALPQTQTRPEMVFLWFDHPWGWRQNNRNLHSSCRIFLRMEKTYCWQRAVSSLKFCSVLMNDKTPKTLINSNLNNFIQSKTLLKSFTCHIYFSIYRGMT